MCSYADLMRETDSKTGFSVPWQSRNQFEWHSGEQKHVQIVRKADKEIPILSRTLLFTLMHLYCMAINNAARTVAW